MPVSPLRVTIPGLLCLGSLACGADAATDLAPGLRAEFFARSPTPEEFLAITPETVPTLVRTDATIDVEGTDANWPQTLLAEHFAIRWSGVVRVPAAGKYTFTLESDDGSRLRLDGAVVIDHGGTHGMEEKSADVDLTAGDHPVQIDYFQSGGGMGCRWYWQTGAQGRSIVPAAVLFHPGTAEATGPRPALPDAPREPGLVAEFFPVSEELGPRIPDLPEAVTPALRRVDETIDVTGSDKAWPGTQLTENYYIRWTGIVRVPTAGTWFFATESDDASFLSIDGQVLVENGGNHEMTEITKGIELAAGDHALRLDYRQTGGDAGCRLRWVPPNGTKAVIPAEALFHAKP